MFRANRFTEKVGKRLPNAGGGKDGELLFIDTDFLFGMTKSSTNSGAGYIVNGFHATGLYTLKM